MRSPRELIKEEILRAAGRFRWFRKLPKRMVNVEELELPARPLMLEAAGVPPNDPTNSHQAIAILENLGFETRHAGESANPHQHPRPVAPVGRPKEEGWILEIFSNYQTGP
jgi:hypothetical protein